ncbi:MAG: riboflavin biosynthesis protein RibF [Methylotenera sp. 24-45-7]|jgi:riboflavin kinase/FMN adenylyltransferase|nr:MAG: riboflavin biosynthesis protein RibF [Methylophilales bacterium 16-45-9]OYZ41465.1 MAG: riboflavin biosynthesis protein RibF [Methylotenera sp. 24-45-7]OZA08259.1 MAG: riboflavin biosynthesis protein RibF [Methylotenera sp. 17-45-7]OZA53393.1 MAG: riboflavin biosynthesis protein RibF [Methylophilales bacterium 39-45-7]HQS37763.1 bifunctional riboflavin kinase/FAD synthetase [Methylotenera sp.]
MQVFRHIPSLLQPPTALAIGNFDGMHLGHQALLNQLMQTAQAKKLIPAVMTFEPHPREFFTPETAPARLRSLREKLEYLTELGVARVYIMKFNRKFAGISAQAFMQNILREALNAQSILVGSDFKFGAKRAGSVDDFKAAGFDLIDLPQVDMAGERVSSTRVRQALADGRLQEAATLLGRQYSISGKVVHGAQRGRTIGFPTANVHMRHERPALTGVYAVKLDGLHAVANLGVRPTIAGIPKLSLEVHVLDFNGNLYDKHVHVEFFHKIRDEIKFDGLDALKAQIAKDVAVARKFFDFVIPTQVGI